MKADSAAPRVSPRPPTPFGNPCEINPPVSATVTLAAP